MNLSKALDRLIARIPVIETEPLCTKECGACGSVYHKIPRLARLEGVGVYRGFYFECECNSTLFVPVGEAA